MVAEAATFNHSDIVNSTSIHERLRILTQDPVRRWSHTSLFDKRPVLQASLDWDPGDTPTQAEFRMARQANEHWKLDGTDARDDDTHVILEIGGGIELAVETDAGDEMILKPQTVNGSGTPTSGLENVRFNLAVEPYMFLAIEFGYSNFDPTFIRFGCGFRNAITSAFTEATSLDHVMLWWDPDSAVSADKFRLSTRVAASTTNDLPGTHARAHTIADGGVAYVRILEIYVAPDKSAHAWIDNQKMPATAPLGTQTGFHLKPIIGARRRTGGAIGTCNIFPKCCILSAENYATI